VSEHSTTIDLKVHFGEETTVVQDVRAVVDSTGRTIVEYKDARLAEGLALERLLVEHLDRPEIPGNAALYKAARQYSGLSIERLAQHCAVSCPVIMSWETDVWIQPNTADIGALLWYVRRARSDFQSSE